MARPKRFELLTPRFVVWCPIIPARAPMVAIGSIPDRLGHSLDELSQRQRGDVLENLSPATNKKPCQLNQLTGPNFIYPDLAKGQVATSWQPTSASRYLMSADSWSELKEASHIDESAGVAASLGDDNTLLPWEGENEFGEGRYVQKRFNRMECARPWARPPDFPCSPRSCPPRSNRAPGSNRHFEV
jgi:hypothetical protein